MFSVVLLLSQLCGSYLFSSSGARMIHQPPMTSIVGGCLPAVCVDAHNLHVMFAGVFVSLTRRWQTCKLQAGSGISARERTGSYGSGIPARERTESDGSGIPARERTGSDGSGIPAQERTESDGSGIPARERTGSYGSGIPARERTGSYCSGIPARERTESDSSGIPARERTESSGSGIPAREPTESDGSGIPARERTGSYGSGIPAHERTESDGSGIPARERTGSDGSGIPAQERTESDVSGIPARERTGTDGSGIPAQERTESDCSGIPARERTQSDVRTLLEKDGSVRSFQIHKAALFRDAPLAPIRGRPNKTRGKKVRSTIPGWHTAVRGTLLYVIEKQRKAETYHWKLECTNISGLEHWQSTNTYCIDCIGARSLKHSCIVRNATRRCKKRHLRCRFCC